MDDKNKLQQNIKKAMNTSRFHSDKTTSVDEIGSGTKLHSTVSQPKPAFESRVKTPFAKKLKGFGIALLVVFGLAMTFTSKTGTVDVSGAANKALSEQTSTSLSAGTILLAKDEELSAQDYTIAHSSNKNNTKIWIWDYAAEDGDYVQLLVNGAPIGDAFFIKNKPVELTVPTVGIVQVKGIRDGGGGITYAVRYDLNSTTYFNSAPKGEMNTYTLELQQ